MWSSIVGEFDLDSRELLVLEQAARQADAVALLAAEAEGSGIVTRGSRGQLRLSQTVVELRQARLALSRLLGELTGPEWISLAFGHVDSDDIFASDEDRYEAWLAHRDEYMESHKPGSRPGAWWRYEAPEGAPDRADYRGRYDGWTNTIVPDDEGKLTTAEYELARLRFLASHGLFDDDEIAALLPRPGGSDLTPYARERAQLDADAVLDALAGRERTAKNE